jgi:hypothetical protein
MSARPTAADRAAAGGIAEQGRLDAAAVEPVSDDALAVGMRVAHEYAEGDRLDPTRPSLGLLVARAVETERRAHPGRRSGDGAHDALLDRIAGVIAQRLTLADEQERGSETAYNDARDDLALARSRWARELRGQVDTLRSTLTDDEAAEVTRRVNALRASQ